MAFTTLNKIHTLSPPIAVWERLLKSQSKEHPDDEAISLARVLQVSGLQFALGCCQLVPEFDKHWRLYAVWCARQVVFSSMYKEGPLAIALAERFANGQATQAEFEKMQTLMAPHLELADGAPGKTAAATTHMIAGLAAQITAARGGPRNSDRRLGGNSAQMKARNAHKRSRRNETYKKEPHSGLQGEGRVGGDQGREDTSRIEHAV